MDTLRQGNNLALAVQLRTADEDHEQQRPSASSKGINIGKRVAISGTYGTGKTTTTKLLSRLTGLPPAVARGMRDILPETFPGRKLEECDPNELVQLGMIRFAERKAQEIALQDGFISDGSAVHEWAYGCGRMLEGANGRGSEVFGSGYKFAMGAFGEVVKRHSKRSYSDIIHLPIEFPLPKDGHRPVSEEFRQKADEILQETWASLGFNPHIIGGTEQERVARIIDALGLKVSPTLNGPEQRPNGRLWFYNADDALGPSNERYFSSGFRNTFHTLYDIEIDPVNGSISSKVDLRYLGDWSKKGDVQRRPHLTSVDSILITGQLAEMLLYAQDGITRGESKNLWLRGLELNPGCRPIEEVTGMPAVLRIIKNCRPKLSGTYWHTASIETDIANGAFKLAVKVGYELPARLQP